MHILGIIVIALVALLLIPILILGLIGTTLMVYGDVIIFAIIAWFVIKHFIKKRKGKG